MRKLGAALAAAFLVVLAFTGCAPATTFGDVVDKEYIAPYTYWYNQCYSYRSDGTCSVSMLTEQKVDAVYKVKVLNDTGVDAWLYVTAEEYKSLELGEFYDAES